MPFQPGYSPLEQRMEHLEREFVRLGQSGQNANQQAQGAAGRGAVVVEATGTLTGPIPEDQVIFDATGGHDHSAGNSTAVPMSGDVTGTNQAAVVVGIEGVPLSGAPAAGDDHQFIRYDLGLGQFVYSGAVMLAPDAVDRNLVQPTANGVKALSLKAKAGGGEYIFDCLDSNGNQIIRVADSSVDNALTITPPDDNLALAVTLVAGATNPYFFCQTTNGNAWRMTAAAAYEVFCASDLGTVSTFTITPSLTDTAHATTKSRVVFQTYDGNFGANARTNLIMEADGSAARTGFNGAAAVVRQTAAAAATDLATVITLANSLRTGLIADGLFA